MKITYRRVHLQNENEMQTIAEIDMSIPAKFDPLFQVNEQTISDRRNQLMKCKETDFFDVAVSAEGRIVGYHFMNQFKSPQGVMAAMIQTLWVDPAFRHQGIAKTLKDRGEAWARELSLDHITTFVNSQNAKMIEFNRKLGFEIVGHQLRKGLK